MQQSTRVVSGLVSWVYTDDLEATSVFYRDVLGFVCDRDEGRARLFRTADNAWIGVCEAFEGRVVQPVGSMISIVTTDVDAWYRRLLAHGVVVDPPHRLETFGIYCLLLRDPSGYALEIQQFDD